MGLTIHLFCFVLGKGAEKYAMMENILQSEE